MTVGGGEATKKINLENNCQPNAQNYFKSRLFCICSNCSSANWQPIKTRKLLFDF